MVTKKIPALLAACACIALGACSTPDSTTSDSAMRDSPTTAGGMATGSSTDSSMAARTGATNTPAMQDRSSSASATSTSSYALVQLIEAMPRAQAMAGATMLNPTADASGTSGSAGTMTESGSGSDNVYRVTLRMDDGSTKAVVMETRPALQIGDRVRMANGALQRF